MWSNGVWGAGDWAAMSLMMLLFWEAQFTHGRDVLRSGRSL